MIRGLVLDFDGLIVDSESADMQAWLEEANHAGVPMTEQTFARLWEDWAWTRRQPLIEYLRKFASDSFDEATVAVRRLVRCTDLGADLSSRPGIREWIRDAFAMGLRLAVATNSAPDRVHDHLVRLGLDGYFSTVVALDDGRARKPAPDLYTRALETLDLLAAHVVALEDSSHGIRAAQRAGIRVIAYPNQLTARTDLSEADLIITDASQITLADALRQLPQVSIGAYPTGMIARPNWASSQCTG